jgi:hypothetical protein
VCAVETAGGKVFGKRSTEVMITPAVVGCPAPKATASAGTTTMAELPPPAYTSHFTSQAYVSPAPAVIAAAAATGGGGGGGGGNGAQYQKDPSEPINAPGHWDFFLSHTQRSGHATTLAAELFTALAARGFTCWLDVRMAHKVSVVACSWLCEYQQIYRHFTHSSR